MTISEEMIEPFPPLARKIEGELICAAKRAGEQDRTPTWAELARAVAAMPEVAASQEIERYREALERIRELSAGGEIFSIARAALTHPKEV